MAEFSFSMPVNVVFGCGALDEIGDLAKPFGERVLLVCDPYFSKSGLASRVCKNLAASGVTAEIYDKVIPNPTTESIDEGAGIVREKQSCCVIGLGGGSSMDTAKGIAVAATHDGPIWDYAMGEKEIGEQTLPVIAVPTTSGTGSHCTCFSVITNPATNQKPGMGSPRILPKIALVDPELMLTVPPAMTLLTGFDVFAHAVEALTSTAASPMSDLYAEKAIALTVEYLPCCMADGGNLDARTGMALADTYSGIAICHAVVSLGHVIAHVIGGHYHDIAHGDALHTIYREVLKLNATALPEKHRTIANLLEPGNDDVVSAYDHFFDRFAFEDRLKTKNPNADMIDKLARETFTYMKAITEFNPVAADVPEARTILEQALGMR